MPGKMGYVKLVLNPYFRVNIIIVIRPPIIDDIAPCLVAFSQNNPPYNGNRNVTEKIPQI
jgi:hypothetical protein